MSRIHMAAGLNLCINALLLYGVGCMTGQRPRLWRLLAAAALGAAHAAVCLRPDCRPLGALPCRLLVLTLMGLLTFGGEGRAAASLLLVTPALENAVAQAGRGGWWQLAACIAALWLLGGFCPQRRVIPVEITRGNRTLRLRALYDTGNELRDPVTGEGVLVIGSGEALRLTGLTERQLESPLQTMESRPLPGLRLVPYQSVGAKNGLLLAMRFPDVRIGGRSRPALVAFAPQSFGREYQALAGGFLC